MGTGKRGATAVSLGLRAKGYRCDKCEEIFAQAATTPRCPKCKTTKVSPYNPVATPEVVEAAQEMADQDQPQVPPPPLPDFIGDDEAVTQYDPESLRTADDPSGGTPPGEAPASAMDIPGYPEMIDALTEKITEKEAQQAAQLVKTVKEEFGKKRLPSFRDDNAAN